MGHLVEGHPRRSAIEEDGPSTSGDAAVRVTPDFKNV